MVLQGKDYEIEVKNRQLANANDSPRALCYKPSLASFCQEQCNVASRDNLLIKAASLRTTVNQLAYVRT